MKSETISPSNGATKNHNLETGTYGHIKWLTERKNKTLLTGTVDMDSVAEICFAYTTDPEELQKFKGPKAKAAIDRFMLKMQPADFLKIQGHAERELLKYVETSTVPKKSLAVKSRPQTKSAHARKR